MKRLELELPMTDTNQIEAAIALKRTALTDFITVGVQAGCYAAIAIVHSLFVKLVKRYPKPSVHYDKASSDKFSSS